MELWMTALNNFKVPRTNGLRHRKTKKSVKNKDQQFWGKESQRIDKVAKKQKWENIL